MFPPSISPKVPVVDLGFVGFHSYAIGGVGTSRGKNIKTELERGDI